jgi:hypothetical protein
MSSYGGKLFLHISKLEWFKSYQIRVHGNVFFVQKDLTEEILTIRDAGVSRVHYFIFWGSGERGF